MPQLFAHNPIGKPFIELQSVDSTNNYARSLLNEGMAEHGTTVFAHEQLAGKGQRGKAWSTEKDSNIILSIIINAQLLQLSRQFELSVCIAVAVREFFAKYLEDTQIDLAHEKRTPDSLIIESSLNREKTLTKIKWPNDLYYEDKKAGGILIENMVAGNIDGGHGGTMNNIQEAWQWAIIGIGINVNQTHFPPVLLNPISLKQITGQHFDIIDLAKELCCIVNTWFEKLITEGFNNIYAQYLTHLYKKNETVRLKKESRVFEAVIKTVSPSGQLIVQHGIEEEFGFGEVEWIKEVK